MRVVKRLAIALLCILLLILCVVAWVRSYLPEHFTLRTADGAVVFIFYDQEVARSLITPNGTKLHLGTREALNYAQNWQTQGTPTTARFLKFEVSYTKGQPSWGFFIVSIPFWFLALPLTATTAISIVSLRRHRRWKARGCCPACGYDLRATPAHCPECGWKSKVTADDSSSSLESSPSPAHKL